MYKDRDKFEKKGSHAGNRSGEGSHAGNRSGEGSYTGNRQGRNSGAGGHTGNRPGGGSYRAKSMGQGNSGDMKKGYGRRGYTGHREIKENSYMGRQVTLKLLRKTDFGVYLGDGEKPWDDVLLPAKEVPQDAAIGDMLTVFVYRDSDDRPVATVKDPLIKLDGIAVLKVAQVNKVGAFLEWGLDKQLFLPYREILGELHEGDEVLARLYLDKSQRLCASQKHLYDYLYRNCPYERDDIVKARVYEFGHDFGTFVAIEDKYSAMIPRKEGREGLEIGQVIEVRVVGIKEDGKVDVSLRKKAYEEIDADAEKVMKAIEEFGGVLPFTDKASPEVIYREMSMSKAAFKRAVGHLYKERRVIITDTAIRKVTGED